MIVKGYIIKDSNTKIIVLNSRTLLKNKKTGFSFEASGEFQVDDFNDLVKLVSTTRIKSIIHKETQERINELEYLDLEKELLANRIYDQEEYEHRWKSLDDEFNYRKFIASYNKENETVYLEEEVIVDELTSLVMKINHPFIQSKFYQTGEATNICVYNKPQAYLGIVQEKMKEIGAEFLGDTDKTVGKLSWSNSTHSCIRFAKFSGDYLFNDGYDVKSKRTGTLEVLEKEYEEDRSRIRKVIHDRFLLKFGRFDEQKTPRILEAIGKLNASLSSISSIIPTKKTYDDKLRSSKYVREALELLNNSFTLEK
jgi:hypothetical protein